MKRLYSVTVAMAALLLVGSAAHAANISKGVSELSGDVNITYDYQTQGSAVSPTFGNINESKTDTLSGIVRFGYGYFITDAIQLGGNISENISSSKPYTGGNPEAFTTEVFQTSLDATAKYHFMQLTKKKIPLVPYAGLQAGYVHVTVKRKNDFNKQQETYNADALGFGGMAGVKFFITENLALNGELNYKHFDVELLKGLPKFKHDQISALFGLSYYFDK